MSASPPYPYDFDEFQNRPDDLLPALPNGRIHVPDTSASSPNRNRNDYLASGKATRSWPRLHNDSQSNAASIDRVRPDKIASQKGERELVNDALGTGIAMRLHKLDQSISPG
jgi:hypothetical protein